MGIESLNLKHFCFISGFANDFSIYQPLIEELKLNKKNYTCFNLPNFELNQNKSFKENLAVVFEFLEQKIPFNAIVIASSLAGMLILELMNKSPKINKKVDGVVLVGTNLSFVQTESWQDAMPKIKFNEFKINFLKNPQKTLNRFFILELFGDGFDEKISQHQAKQILEKNNFFDFETLKIYLNFLENLDLTKTISEISLNKKSPPIQFIFAQNDYLVPVEAKNKIKKLRGGVSKISFSTIKNSSHLPMLTHPKKMKKKIIQFLSTHL